MKVGRLRFYVKDTRTQRLYFSERNRRGRHRLVRVGWWQLWVAINPPTIVQ